MLRVTDRFRRTDRILRSGCFRRVLRGGERFSSRNFVVFVAVDLRSSFSEDFPGERSSGERLSAGRSSRLGITVSKRVGNSVVRNHVKRRIREWYRRRRNLPAGMEIVVIARRPARDLATKFLFEDLDQVIQKYQLEAGKVN